MKKIVSIVVAAVIAAALAVPMFATADAKNHFTVSTVTAENGKAIVAIEVENNTPFSAADFVIYYNRVSIKLTAYQKGEVINTAGGLSMVNAVKDTGMVKMSAATADAFRRTGAILYLYFDVPDGAHLYTPITLDITEMVDFDLKKIEFTIKNGGIARTPYVTSGQMSQPEVSEVKEKAEKDLENAANAAKVASESETYALTADPEVSEMPAAVYDPAQHGGVDPNSGDKNLSEAMSKYESAIAEDSELAVSEAAASEDVLNKTSGNMWITIIIAGVIVLLLAGGLLYYLFVIRKKKAAEDNAGDR